MTTDLPKLQSALETLPDLQLAYLFGSRANPPYARAESDYDLVLSFDAPLTAHKKLALIEQLSDQLQAPVDLIDLRNTTTVLAKEVVTTGQCLFYQTEMQRDLYEARIRTQYCHLNESRKESLLNHLPAALLERI